MSPLKLNFDFPIQESHSENIGRRQDFFIRGVAINETTTRNNHTFVAKELKRATNSLKNKPILKDHKNEIDSIVGRTTENIVYDEALNAIRFEAKIMDEKMQKMISDGLITSVSVGAAIEDYEVDEDSGSHVLKGIDFLELSLVAVPADPNAGFAKAISEAFEKEAESKFKCPECGKAIPIEDKKKHMQTHKEEKMETEVKTESVVTQAPSIDVQEFAKVKAELQEFKEKEARAKMESEIRAKVIAELKATEKPVVSEEKATSKLGIAEEKTEKVNSEFRSFGWDASTGDKPAVCLSSYDPQRFPNLAGRR